MSDGKSRCGHSVEASGSVWLIGWLFTIGYVQLPFWWKGLLALIIWPYYLGSHLATP